MKQPLHVKGHHDLEAFCNRAMPWLKEDACLPMYRVMDRKLEARVTEVLFNEWVLWPSNTGATPGYMHLIPSLYESATVEPTLRQAVDACAFANMRKFTLSDTDFAALAMSSYGAALASLRASLDRPGFEMSDSLFAAIMLIDMFEVGCPSAGITRSSG